MKKLSHTIMNVALIEAFINKTKKRIKNGASITFTDKAQQELADLTLSYDISTDDIENAILNLTPENYLGGIDPSKAKGDFDVCAFHAEIGTDNVGIYLKYGLENNGLQILLFSNHPPNFPISQPFKN